MPSASPASASASQSSVAQPARRVQLEAELADERDAQEPDRHARDPPRAHGLARERGGREIDVAAGALQHRARRGPATFTAPHAAVTFATSTSSRHCAFQNSMSR